MDSGLLATDACSKDARGISRVASARVYREDIPSEECDKHVTVTLCSGGGEPTEWCELFAQVDPDVKFSEKSYVSLTSAEYNAAAKAVGNGLNKAYINKKGLLPEKDEDEDVMCPVHTKEAWEAYLASQTTAPPETTAPSDTTPPETTAPVATTGLDGQE